jgi:hypothetical protein
MSSSAIRLLRFGEDSLPSFSSPSPSAAALESIDDYLFIYANETLALPMPYFRNAPSAHPVTHEKVCFGRSAGVLAGIYAAGTARPRGRALPMPYFRSSPSCALHLFAHESGRSETPRLFYFRDRGSTL